MNTQLLVAHKTLVQSSFQTVLPISNTVAQLFYGRLFELAPDLKRMFTTSIDIQGPKLIAMLAIAVKSLDHLEDLIPALQDLSRRHIGYGVKAEHYALVGKALLWTLEQGLGAAFTAEVEEAWGRVYGLIADVCIDAAYDTVWGQEKTRNSY
jgi:hemoglobin-like flavoprotein